MADDENDDYGYTSVMLLNEADTVVAGDMVVITHEDETSERISADKFGGKALRFTTMALAQAALAIPEGQSGYVPDNAIVIVDEVSPYITAEERVINNNQGE